MKKINIIITVCAFIVFFVVAQTGQLKQIENAFKNLVPSSAQVPPLQPVNPDFVKTFKLESLDIEKADSKEFYEKWLQQEEANVWKGLEAIFGITKQQADELKIKWHDEYVNLVNEMIRNERDAEKPSEENKKLVDSILHEYNLDPAFVETVVWKEPVSGGSTDRTVFINEKRLTPMPLMVKKFVIAHEIAHVHCKDHSTDFVLAKLRQINNIPDSPQLTKALQDFAYFKELRADIIAMLHGNDYVRGQIMYMEHQIKASGGAVQDESTHPNDRLRYTIGNRLLIAINQ